MSDVFENLPQMLRSQGPLKASVRILSAPLTGREWCERIERSPQMQLTPRLVSGADSTSDFEIELSHPVYGSARLLPKGVVPDFMLEFAPNLDETVRILAASEERTDVLVECPPATGNLLRDKKTLFAFLTRVLFGDGILAFDHSSTLFWTGMQLALECSHIAEVDVESLYAIHAITASDGKPQPDDRRTSPGPRCDWLHTHGLAELGGFDVDVLRPHPSNVGVSDLFRSIAFAIIEGEVKPDTPRWHAFRPTGEVSFVPVAEFHRLASKQDAALRQMDEYHSTNRSVICDVVQSQSSVPSAAQAPAQATPKSFLKGLFGGRGAGVGASGEHGASGAVRPAQCLQSPIPQQFTCAFSPRATELMARRAQDTLALATKFAQEFQDLEARLIVKVGVRTDKGKSQNSPAREHLWFGVLSMSQGSMTGVLMNKPFDIAAMRQGNEYTLPLEDLTDWNLMMPVGDINPRETSLVTKLRMLPQDNRADLARRIRASRTK